MSTVNLKKYVQHFWILVNHGNVPLNFPKYVFFFRVSLIDWKVVIAFFSGINDRLFVTLSIKQISNFFVKIFECISIKLPWKLPSVIYLWIQCYNERFQVSPTSACIFVKILKDIEISKVTVHVNFFGKFLRSGAEMLGKTIHEMCNLLISLNMLLDALQSGKT